MSDASSRRPAPSATGKLASTPLAHALVYARNRRLTGNLEVRSPEGSHARITFWRGRITGVRSAPPICYFGTVVYELGWIDAETLDATLMDVAREKRLHGEVLVERGAITPAQRVQALVEQACRKVHHLMDLPPETGFAFYDAEPSVSEPAVLLDPIAPVWRGIRDRGHDPYVAQVLAHVGAAPLKVVNEAPLLAAGLSREERALCEALTARPLTVAQMRARTPLPVERVDRLAYLLVIAKCAEPAPVAATPSGSVPATRPSSGALPAAPASSPGPARTPSLPGLPRPSPPSIRAPRESGGPRWGGGSGEVRRPPSFRVPPLAPPSSPKLAADPPPPPGPADLGGEAIAARAAGVESEDYFVTLGVPEGASAEAVRAAYFRLAKVWHPDRLPPELAGSRDDVARVFAHMDRAHRTLTDPDARRAWLASRSAPAAQAQPRPEVLRQIDQLLAKRDFSGAEALSQALVDADGEDAEALAALAWARAWGGDAGPDALRAAMKQLDRAIGNDRYCERAYFYRGLLQKKLGHPELAFRDFARVVQINPRHVDAEREVRLHEMRARKGSGEHALGGLLRGNNKKK